MMPELVRIGGLTLYTYGFMWVVGIWLAVWWGLRRAPRYGVAPDDALDIAFWSVLTGIVGGRLAFVLTNWSQYAPDPLSVLRVWEGGMSYFGGFGLAIATAIYLIRARRIPIWAVGAIWRHRRSRWATALHASVASRQGAATARRPTCRGACCSPNTRTRFTRRNSTRQG
jgi:Prolipoprotein diacylglyceryltransferase